MADRLTQAGYEAVGAGLAPFQAGDHVTFRCFVTPTDLVVQRLVLASGMTESAVETACADFARQLGLRGGGHTTGVLTFVFGDKPDADALRRIRQAPFVQSEQATEIVSLYSGAFNAETNRYAGFNREPVGLIAEELSEVIEGRESSAGSPRNPIIVTNEQKAALDRLVDARQNVFFVWAILSAIAVVFVIMFITKGPRGFHDLEFLLRFGALHGANVGQGQVWRLLTSLFVHIGFMHFLFNVYALYLLGRDAEACYGGLRFLVIYFCGGLCGGAASVISKPQTVSAGASGAIFGLVGALIAFALINKQSLPRVVFSRWVRGMITIVVINIIIGLSVAMIDNTAHLGGLTGGFLFGLALSPRLMKTSSRTTLLRHLAVIPLLAGLAFGVYASYARNVHGAHLERARDEVVKIYNSVIAEEDQDRRDLRDYERHFFSDAKAEDKAEDCKRILVIVDKQIAAAKARKAETAEGEKLLDAYREWLASQQRYWLVLQGIFFTKPPTTTQELAEAKQRAITAEQDRMAKRAAFDRVAGDILKELDLHKARSSR